MNQMESVSVNQQDRVRGLTLLQIMTILAFLGVFVTAILRYYFEQ